MLDTFSKDIVYLRLPPPYTQTLFVELIRFIPGQPDYVTTGPSNGGNAPHALPSSSMGHSNMNNGGSNSQSRQPSHGPRSSHSNGHGQGQGHGHGHGHHSYHHGHGHGQGHESMSGHALKSTSPIVPYERGRSPGASPHHVPPPPPWSADPFFRSRWSHAAAAAAPPTARSNSGVEPLNSPLHTPPQTSVKRKHPDDGPSQHDDRPISLITPPMQNSPKRQQSSHTPQPTARSTQGLSPSLAMIMSPPIDLRSPHQSHASYGPPPLHSVRTHPPPPPSGRMVDDGPSLSRKPTSFRSEEEDRWSNHSRPSPLQTIDLRTRTPPPRH